MRCLNLFLLLLFFNNIIFAQENYGNSEIFINTVNVTANDTTYFYLDAVDAVWDGDYEIATQFNGHSIINSDTSIVGNYSSKFMGFDHVGALSGTWGPKYFGYGYYKVTIKKGINGSEKYFYLDWRDCDYPSAGYPCINDIWLFYDGSINSAGINPGNTCDTVWFSNGESFKLWDIKGKSTFSTSCFELYLTITNNNNHPHLTWNPYHDLNWVDQYNIYRAYEENGQMTPYHLVSSVDDSQLSWTDNSVNLRNPLMGLKYFYKVNAEDNGENQSLYSNTEYIYGIGPIEKAIINTDQESSEFVLSFKLYGNHPNPFNPTTTISFDLPVESFVNLTVYNIYGQGLVRLINNNLEAGSFNVQFNAKNLPSGFYFYKIKAGSFSQIKRMLFIK